MTDAATRAATVDFGASVRLRDARPPGRDPGVPHGAGADHRGLRLPRPRGRHPARRKTASSCRATCGRAIADAARREFNERLKAAKIPVGRWHSGTNLVDRLLGKELCVLAWAAENATDEEIPVICSKWAALRPEERWWLFSMTVAEAGLPEDAKRGWRRALHLALSDGEKAARVDGAGRGRSSPTSSPCRLFEDQQ